jgi:hypothetical protein
LYREAGRDNGAFQACVDRQPFEVRQDKADGKGITCTGLIHYAGSACVPRVETLAMRVVQDSSLRAALEDDETESPGNEPPKRAMRIRLRSFELKFIFTGEKRIDVGQNFPPVVQCRLGDQPVWVDRDEGCWLRASRQHECALHAAGHRGEMKGSSGGPLRRNEFRPWRNLLVCRAPEAMNQAPDVLLVEQPGAHATTTQAMHTGQIDAALLKLFEDLGWIIITKDTDEAGARLP